MAGPTLASTFFQTGPDDELAVVDLYSVTDTKVKTSLMDRFKNTTGNVIGSIIANPDLLRTVASSLTNMGGQVVFDKNSLLSTLSATSMGSRGRSMASDLPSRMMNSIGNNLNTLSNPIKSFGVMSKIGAVINNLAPEHLASSQSINSFLMNLTGDTGIGQTVGLDAEASVLSSFMTEAISIGSVGAFETMLDAYAGKDEYNQVVRGVMAGSFTQSARSGNLPMIQTLVSNLGGRAVLSQLPFANSMIMSNYRFPKGTGSGGYRGELLSLKNTLSSIDPGWDVYNRPVQTIVGDNVVTTMQECRRLDSFSRAHSDARDLFKLDENYKIDAMLADKYDRIDCRANVQQRYPMLSFPS